MSPISKQIPHTHYWCQEFIFIGKHFLHVLSFEVLLKGGKCCNWDMNLTSQVIQIAMLIYSAIGLQAGSINSVLKYIMGAMFFIIGDYVVFVRILLLQTLMLCSKAHGDKYNNNKHTWEEALSGQECRLSIAQKGLRVFP